MLYTGLSYIKAYTDTLVDKGDTWTSHLCGMELHEYFIEELVLCHSESEQGTI